MLFLKRTDCGDRKNPLDAELLERVDVGAKIQLRGEKLVTTAVSRQEGNFAALKFAQDKASLGSPNGVSTRTSRTEVSPGMAYKPLPPIIPISACCNLFSD